MRQRMKPLQLAITYGMGVPSLASGLNRHPLSPARSLSDTNVDYPRFWQWRAESWCRPLCWIAASRASSAGRSISPRAPTSARCTIFPMQSGGAEMLRLATTRLCDAGIVPIMLIHDGILFEDDRPREQLDHAIEIMRGAGRDVCGGLKIGVDVDQRLEGGARYMDKRPMAQKMWATIMDVLQAIGALPKKEVA